MFTGIIFEQGTIQKSQLSPSGLKLTVSVQNIPQNIRKGSSIAIDGICLTLLQKKKSTLSFFAMNETLDKTQLGQKEKGDRVNVEYPLNAGDFISGHFVSGHIDALLTVKKCVRSPKGCSLTIFLPSSYAPSVIFKGSVALNGVSLTVSRLFSRSFVVSLIPITLQKTNLSLLREGDRVNVEFDMIGKFVAHILRGKL